MADLPEDTQRLRERLAAAEETLASITSGAIDALVVSTADGPKIFTLQGADEFYRVLVENMSEGALVVRPDGRVVYANTSAARLAGRATGSVIGASVSTLVDPRDHDRLARLLSRSAGTSEAHLRFTVAPTDAVRHVAVAARAIPGADDEPSICLIVFDRTADLRAENDRRDAEVLLERERVARDLHDTVIQSLFAAGLRLEGMRQRTEDSVSAQLEEVIDDIDATIRSIRMTIFDLRPPSLADDVQHSVNQIVAAAEHSLGYRAELELSGDLTRVPRTAVGDLLAVLRETLSNAARHAQATRVTVSVAVEDASVTLSVDDDGRGLAPNRTESGLSNLRVRAESHNGTFSAVSTPGRPGTVITWRIPLSTSIPV